MTRTLLIAVTVLSGAMALPATPGIGEAKSESRSPKMAKGVEMYSWVSKDDTFRFSLLPGTNRNKSESEIKAASVATDVAGIESRLARLAKGENVYWMWTPAACTDCKYPTTEVVERIRRKAAELEIDLIVYPKW